MCFRLVILLCGLTFILARRIFHKKGHHRSAGHYYLRAATYRRAALHRHPDPYHPEVPIQAQLAVSAFEKFITEFEYPCKPVKIPYEDTTLPGYLCIGPNINGPAPTIIFQEGKDGWAEDGKFIVDEAIPRGYNVLLFDGPGMGKVMRLQGLPFRHDWENVSSMQIVYLFVLYMKICTISALANIRLFDQRSV